MEANTTAFRIKAIFAYGLALAVLLAGGALAGFVFAAVGTLFYIHLVFPAGMGVAAGALVQAARRLTGLRRRVPLVLVCVLAAVLVYGGQHYARYRILQALVSAQLFQYELLRDTGHSGLLGFMLLRAQTGISIGRFYHDNPVRLTGFPVWLFWAFELGLVTWLALLIGRSTSRVPVCESCGRRLSREKHLGGTTPGNEGLLLELIRRNDLAGLGDLLQKDAGLPSLELYLRRCEACGQGATGHLTVRRAFQGTRGAVQLADVAESTLGPDESQRFLSQLRYELD